MPRLAWPTAGGAAPSPARVRDSGAAEDQNGQAVRDARRIAELEQQIEKRAKEAQAAGYREGEAAGRAQASAALQPVLDKLARGIQEIAALRPQILRDATADLVNLSLGIARRILHRELSVDPAALEGLIAGALQKMPSQDISRIRIHPELEPGVRQALAHAGRGNLPLFADGTLERGAILLETARGKLDASLETQLTEIGRGLADRLPEK
ncbi:MAG TPA: FliH/SctL family protein [Bryobacteraceae bacterium]|nr:FliH/SctL family protein [Bryobacteraceae bacterium]